ncbi:MAG: hypothetical protein EXX96DRAFT_591515 [Benjaminiella poitrasii]|nr:MAG: hypothetical protein EXX96DRAFT_591515 [Benjaminiella poitrasii]
MTTSATAPINTLNLPEPSTSTTTTTTSTTPKKNSRSRASSVTSNIINELKESSTIQSIANKIKSRHSATDTEAGEQTSFDNLSTAATSIAGVNNFYVANPKRNSDFHALFRSIPENDSLVEDFGCALQKEILLQGRIYISEDHICFNANIFGWVTNLVIAFADIINIEKKATAYFIPNAIQISTENAKHFFASFLSRDQAYELMVDIWRIARPDLIPPKEGSQITQQTTSHLDSESSSEESGSYYDSDTEEDSFTSEGESDTDELNGSSTPIQEGTAQNRKVSLASLPVNSKDTKNIDAARRRAISEAPRPSFKMEDNTKTPKPNDNSTSKKTAKSKTSSTKGSDEGIEADSKGESKQLHEKTECDCGNKGEHFPNIVMDQTYDTTLENLYNLIFGGGSGFMKTFLIDNQKSQELDMGEWKKGEGSIESTREVTYIKPLYGAIGPKSTKCYMTQDVIHKDISKYVSIMSTTLTPDVPSGSSFSCKTRTCLTWAGKEKARMLVTVQVEFTKSSWLKSTIEKASIDGQQTYYKDLDAELRTYLKEHSENTTDANKRSEGRRRKKGRRSKTNHRLSAAVESSHHAHKNDEAHKSVVHQVLGVVSNKLADGITGIISIASSPRAAHFTLFCLIVMVFINLYIARKMAFVEQQLSELSRVTGSSDDSGLFKDATYSVGAQQREYNRQEEDDLWAWLGRIDPDGANERTEQVKIPIAQDPKEQEAIWDDAIKISKTAKERLDKHMMELSKMIQRAESNLEDVTKVVNEQRQKIRQT